MCNVEFKLLHISLEMGKGTHKIDKSMKPTAKYNTLC